MNNKEITYRKLTEQDIDTFIKMRITQLREEGATEDFDLVPALKDYYHRHLADGTFVSWLALDGAKIIGTSGMSFVEKPPYFGCPSGKNRPPFQHVHKSKLPPDGNCQRVTSPCGRRSPRLRLWCSPDYCIRYGSKTVYRIRLCSQRKLYAV